MSLLIHMTLKGHKQGLISEGCCNKAGRSADTIAVMQLDHVIDVPRDMSTGRATGKRVHRPVVVQKEIDRSSPLLNTALVTNELFEEVRLEYYRPNPDGDGTDEQFYTVVLRGANLVTLKTRLPFTLALDSSQYPPMEELQFTYKSIEWEYKSGGDSTSGSDSWDSQS